MYRQRLIIVLLISVFTNHNSFCQQFSNLPPGFDNMVRCVTYDTTNNLFYVGGNFNFYGFPYQPNNPINKIAVWNGNNWDSLGSGVTQPGYLVDLAMYNGNLLAGGSYNEIGGVSAKGIALWNGISWQPFASLYDSSASSSYGCVFVIKVIDNDLYIGGCFNRVNGIIADSFTKFDGSTWTVYPPLGLDATVNAIALYNNELYVGGNFNNGNGLIDFAKFDGSNWVSVGGWSGGGFDHVTSLEVFQGKLIVGGQFSNATGAVGNNIAAWDGNSWTTLQSGLNYATISMQTKDSVLYVSGMFTIAGGQSANRIVIWDGNNWTNVGQNEPLNSAILDFAFGNSTLLIGGNFTQINSDTINFVAKMDLSTSLFETPDNNESLEVFPNPTTDLISITSNGKFLGEEFLLFDVAGRSIMRLQINKDSTIDAGMLAPAIYFYEVRGTNGEKVNGKILKL